MSGLTFPVPFNTKMAYYFSFFFFPDRQISFDLDSLCLDVQNNNNKINKENNKKKVLH